MFRKSYGEVFEGDENWKSLEIPEGDRYAWDEDSTYVKRPPYFEGMAAEAPEGFDEIKGARALAMLGDSVTTDHISPAGAIKQRHAGRQVPARARRRAEGLQLLRLTARQPRGDDARHLRQRAAAQPARPGYRGRLHRRRTARTSSSSTPPCEYQSDDVPLCVLAGKEYGSGSSRDWAAKGPRLLGVRFVIAESYERIHRSNLVGMGILPLQFPDGETAESLGLDGLRRPSTSSRWRTARASSWRQGHARGRRRPDRVRAPACGSTRPTSGSTTATAGSCTSCCASCAAAPETAARPAGAGPTRPCRRASGPGGRGARRA